MAKKVFQEKKVIECLICLLFLSTCHWIQFIRSGFVIQAGIRAICSSFALIFTLFTGRKYWSQILFIWAIAILYWNRFHNYTSFIMILIAIWMKPKNKLFYLIVYGLGVLAACVMYKDTVTHIVIHGLGCCFFYLFFATVYHILQYFKKVIRFLHGEIRILRNEKQKLEEENKKLRELEKTKLSLNPDEIIILNELISGKEVKELDIYSQNTIYVRLRQARERNNCLNNDELLLRYKNEIATTEVFSVTQ